MEKVPIGIPELDSLLRGGLPKNGICLVAGGPGTGKTILGAQFLYYGATKYNEPGVLVSFSENTKRFIGYMLELGWDFQKLVKEKKVAILDMVSTKSGAIDETLSSMFEKVHEIGAKRLVVDSVSAIILANESKIDTRIVVSLLHKALERADCTTILITETPWGSTGIGTGVEEFVGDGIILMETFVQGSEFKRRLAIPKMRGADHDTRRYTYLITKANGISIIPYPEAAV